jgi:hypothetical protein
MAVRFSREGYEYVDPVGAGSTSSGARVYDDGTKMAPYEHKPWESRMESEVSDTLRLMAIPGDQLAQIRPPVPYLLFPEEELGYVPQALTIEEVLDTPRWSPQIRSWMSPTIRPPVMRADYQDQTWSGTARGVASSANPGL